VLVVVVVVVMKHSYTVFLHTIKAYEGVDV
jgi:hypothetical protein